MKCGLCLPHCPTYRVMKVEGESPRGRIALAQAIATGAIEPTPSLLEQLDDCTACGTCEVVCPSQVRYDELLVRTRAAIDAPRTIESRRSRWLRSMLMRPAFWSVALRFVRGARSRYVRLRPYAAKAPIRERVLLWRGCIARTADEPVHAATSRVLSALGYDVVIPSSAHCCGALDRHAGDVARATRRASAACELFVASGATRIVSTASGCHRDLASGIAPTIDVCTLLRQSADLPPLKLARPIRAAWLASCTERNGANALALLARVGNLSVEELPLQPRCCGAAGLYFLDHAHIANPLREERLDQLAARRPDVLLTTNVGCAVYLRRGLLDRGIAVRVLHPIELIAEALQ